MDLSTLAALVKYAGYAIMAIAYLLMAYHYCPNIFKYIEEDRILRRSSGNKIKIMVITDRRRKQRSCFWKGLLRLNTKEAKHLRKACKLREISISDWIASRRNPASYLFDIDLTDVIVINWDSINGDPFYGSSESLDFFRHYKSDLTAWLKAGGKLIVESQGLAWTQVAIDSYLPFSNLSSTTSQTFLRSHSDCGLGKDIVPAKNPSAEALLKGCNLTVTEEGLWSRRAWLPYNRGTKSVNGAWVRNTPRVYRGAFQEFDGYTPLITDTNERPVMIAQTVTPLDPEVEKVGFVVLTTMFIASSELTDLFHRLVFNLEDILRKNQIQQPTIQAITPSQHQTNNQLYP